MHDDTIENPYAEEARTRWGHTEAYRQSVARVGRMGKEGLARALRESGELTEEIAACMKDGESSAGDRAQALIARHYDGLRAFYDPNSELYRGLAEMYVADGRFAANYERVAPGLAAYMRDAMLRYADTLDHHA